MIAPRFSPQYLQQGQGWYGGGFQGGLPGRGRGWLDDGEKSVGEKPQRSRRSRRSRDDSQKSRKSRDTSQKGRKEDESSIDKNKDTGIKWLGLVLALTSSASISLGVSNTVVTATTVMTAANASGCFAQGQWYQQLGPIDNLKRSLDWSWVTAGLWSAILTYLIGVLAGKIKKSNSKVMKVLRFSVIISLLAFVPARLILAILDSLLSSGCQTSNTVKFALPVAVAVIAVLEFVILAIIFVRLRKQSKKMAEGENDEEEMEEERDRRNGGMASAAGKNFFNLPNPFASPQFPAGRPPFPMGRPPFPMGRPQFPMGRPQFPMGRPQFPMGRPQFPMRRPQFPAGRPPFPAGRPQFPARRPQFPAGRPQFPMVKPAGSYQYGAPVAKRWAPRVQSIYTTPMYAYAPQ